MQRECDRLTGAARHEIDLSTPAETVLKTAARHISPALLSGFYQAVFRICGGVSDRFPDLGETCYRSGQMRLRSDPARRPRDRA